MKLRLLRSSHKNKKERNLSGTLLHQCPAPPHWIDGITASTKVLPAALSAKRLLFSWPNLVQAQKNSFKSCLQHRSIVQAHQKDPSWKRRPTAKQSDFKQQRDTRNFVRQYIRNTSKAFFAFGYFFLPWHLTTNNTNTHLISWFLACGRWTIGFVPEVQCSTHLRIDDLDHWTGSKDPNSRFPGGFLSTIWSLSYLHRAFHSVSLSMWRKDLER